MSLDSISNEDLLKEEYEILNKSEIYLATESLIVSDLSLKLKK